MRSDISTRDLKPLAVSSALFSHVLINALLRS